MGKNAVTEEDLLAGVAGGFGNITSMGQGRPVRDTPFRDTRSEPLPKLETERPPEPTPGVPEIQRGPMRTAPTPLQPVQLAQPNVQPTTQFKSPKVKQLAKPRKTDTYSEKMSTFLTPEMRDELEITARLLHRNRLVKGESITVHTLIRSGIRILTEVLEFTDSDVVNSEEELQALIKKKLGA